MGLSDDWNTYKSKCAVKVFKAFLNEPGIKARFPKCTSDGAINSQVSAINAKIDVVIGGGDAGAFKSEMTSFHVAARSVSSAEFQAFLKCASAGIDAEGSIGDKAGLKAAVSSLNFT